MTGHKKYIQFSGNMVQSPLWPQTNFFVWKLSGVPPSTLGHLMGCQTNPLDQIVPNFH